MHNICFYKNPLHKFSIFLFSSYYHNNILYFIGLYFFVCFFGNILKLFVAIVVLDVNDMFYLRMIVFVMMMEVLVFHFFFKFNGWMMNFLLNDLLFFDYGWLVMMVNTFQVCMSVFVMFLFHGNVNDDLLLAAFEVKITYD